MSKALLGAAQLLGCISTGANAKDTQFWNLTAHTITAFQLSPAGKDDWGSDQTANDNDHSVDHDERLKIKGVATGAYDARLKLADGRECTVKGLRIEASKVFTIEEKELAGCSK